jgi:hypothetical protein
MAGRSKSCEIEKQEANHIRKQARVIQSTINEICHRIQFWKSRGPALRRKILKDYERDQYPWIGSLFPALRDLHGAPTIDNLDRHTIRKVVVAIIRRERHRETGTLHFLGAIDKVLRHL